MLTRLRLKNLKTWSEQLWDPGVDLAPITLLLGPNSAGKTSILQLPLLLKQTFESPDRQLDLNMGGQTTDLVDLGSYEAVVHRHDAEREMGVGLTLHDVLSGDVPDLVYCATYLNRSGRPALKRMEISSGGDLFAAERQGAGGYLLIAPGYAAKQFSNRPDARRSFQPERSIAFSPDAVNEIGASGPKVQDLSLRLRQELGRLAYLGPLRQKPERTYLWGGGEPGDLGVRGEGAVHALLASANTRKRQKEGTEGGKGWLISKVSHWLERLGVADSLELERQGRSRHYEVIVVRGRQRANIMDVGFGVSQVLPMLVLAYFVPRGTTIIAEQPEIHLHPRAQVGLAELMAEVARERYVQFMVETHSEHLFRRLQALLAEGTKVTRRDCALYFVDAAGDDSANLTTLELDDYGRVANWPAHFFGDATGETERQVRATLERMTKDST